MLTVRRGNYSYNRVGHTIDLKPAAKPPWGYKLVGQVVDPGGKTLHRYTLPPYPLLITTDVEFVDCNFAQLAPHTTVFSITVPGVRVVFHQGCNLHNVTAPDDAELHGVQTLQATRVTTVGRGEINVPHDCDRCASYLMALRDAIDDGRWGRAVGDHDGLGRRGDLVKPLAALRRADNTQTAVMDKRNGTLYVSAAAASTSNVAAKDQQVVNGNAVADRAKLRAENEAAIASFGGRSVEHAG